MNARTGQPPSRGGVAGSTRREAGHNRRDKHAHDDHMPGPAEQPQDEGPGDGQPPGEADGRMQAPERPRATGRSAARRR